MKRKWLFVFAIIGLCGCKKSEVAHVEDSSKLSEKQFKTSDRSVAAKTDSREIAAAQQKKKQESAHPEFEAPTGPVLEAGSKTNSQEAARKKPNFVPQLDPTADKEFRENHLALEDETPAEDEPLKKEEYPSAIVVPQQAGFVYSPYNQKVIDVRGMPPGTLVADPTFPSEEKKYFRTPK